MTEVLPETREESLQMNNMEQYNDYDSPTSSIETPPEDYLDARSTFESKIVGRPISVAEFHKIIAANSPDVEENSVEFPLKIPMFDDPTITNNSQLCKQVNSVDSDYCVGMGKQHRQSNDTQSCVKDPRMKYTSIHSHLALPTQQEYKKQTLRQRSAALNSEVNPVDMHAIMQQVARNIKHNPIIDKIDNAVVNWKDDLDKCFEARDLDTSLDEVPELCDSYESTISSFGNSLDQKQKQKQKAQLPVLATNLAKLQKQPYSFTSSPIEHLKPEDVAESKQVHKGLKLRNFFKSKAH